VIYYSFLELGANALACEDAWLCFTQKLSLGINGVNCMLGGMASLFKLFLSTLFTATHNLLDGVVLQKAGAPLVRLFARLGVVVQDGAAHRSTFHHKGESGMNMCMLCLNAFSHNSEIATYAAGTLPGAVLHHTGMALATNHEIREGARRAQRRLPGETDVDWKRRQQATGWTAVSYNILADVLFLGVLFPADQFMYDWMHGMLANGVFGMVAFLLMDALRLARVPDVYGSLAEHVARWRWPRRLRVGSLAKVFAEKRREANRKAKLLRCQASEALSLFPVLEYFVSHVLIPAGVCLDECNVFLDLCAVLHCLTAVARRTVTPDMLRDSVNIFLANFVRVWGPESLVPKFHWMLHYALAYRRLGILISCFVHERKHKLVRRYGNDITNTPTIENAVVGELICDCVNSLSDPNVFNFENGLVRPRPASHALVAQLSSELNLDEGQPIMTSSVSRFSPYEVCQKHDVVLVKEEPNHAVAAQVLHHLDIDGMPLSLVAPWRFVRNDNDEPVWEVRRQPALIATSAIVAVCIWQPIDDDFARTLVPRYA